MSIRLCRVSVRRTLLSRGRSPCGRVVMMHRIVGNSTDAVSSSPNRMLVPVQLFSANGSSCRVDDDVGPVALDREAARRLQLAEVPKGRARDNVQRADVEEGAGWRCEREREVGEGPLGFVPGDRCLVAELGGHHAVQLRPDREITARFGRDGCQVDRPAEGAGEPFVDVGVVGADLATIRQRDHDRRRRARPRSARSRNARAHCNSVPHSRGCFALAILPVSASSTA